MEGTLPFTPGKAAEVVYLSEPDYLNKSGILPQQVRAGIGAWDFSSWL